MKLQTIHTEHRVTDDDGDCGHMVSQSEDGGTKHHPYDSRATTEANHRRAAATHSALRDGSGARTWQSEQVTEYEKEMAARAAAVGFPPAKQEGRSSRGAPPQAESPVGASARKKKT